jgi:hypothetical protein
LTKKQSRSSASFMDGTCLWLLRREETIDRESSVVKLRTLAAQAKSETPDTEHTKIVHVLTK